MILSQFPDIPPAAVVDLLPVHMYMQNCHLCRDYLLKTQDIDNIQKRLKTYALPVDGALVPHPASLGGAAQVLSYYLHAAQSTHVICVFFHDQRHP